MSVWCFLRVSLRFAMLFVCNLQVVSLWAACSSNRLKKNMNAVGTLLLFVGSWHTLAEIGTMGWATPNVAVV